MVRTPTRLLAGLLFLGALAAEVEARAQPITQTMLVVRDPQQTVVARLKDLQAQYAGSEIRIAACERFKTELLFQVFQGTHAPALQAGASKGKAQKRQGGDPGQPVERLIPGAYKVGGRRVSEPTGPVRDSSL